MSVENWNWAVWAYLSLYALGVVLMYLNDGEPRKNKNYSFKDHFLGSSIVIVLLYFGGFFA